MRICTVLAIMTVSVGGLSVATMASANPRNQLPAATPGTPVSSLDDCNNVPSSDNYDALADPYSLYNKKNAMGVDAYYRNNDFGQGIDVAVIDTGVAPVPGLDNVVDGPDLSFESQAPYGLEANTDLPYNDAFGHGTHMASIIAGRDVTTAPYGTDDSTKFSGVAPGARILNMKVADAQGAVDTTQIIASIDWIVEHRNDPSLHLNVRVLNLSYSIRSTDPADQDAVAFALEQAWKAGIFVVVSAGNDGKPDGTTAHLGSPANDRTLMTVGSYDVVTKRSSEFSSAGNIDHADVVAPGEHLMALHVKGSASDDEIADDCRAALNKHTAWSSPIFGEPDAPGRFVRGSGTSQATAMVSGVAALMFSRSPHMVPDQVARILTESATTVAGANSVNGSGKITLDGPHGAYNTRTPTVRDTHYSNVTKGGRIDESRGLDALPCLSLPVAERNRGDINPHPSRGHLFVNGLCSDIMNMSTRDRYTAMDVDIRGVPFSQSAHETEELVSTTWPFNYVPPASGPQVLPWTDTIDGEVWNGNVWAGTTVVRGTDGRDQWTGHRWSGNDWSGHRWSDFDWSGHRWSGEGWSSEGLDGHRWSDSSWSGHRWSGNTFRDLVWQ